MQRRILILAANPKNTQQLQLHTEFEAINEVLDRASQRNHFDLRPPRWETTFRKMQQTVLNEQPQIVHFSGHGEGEAGICLEDSQGTLHSVSADTLADLFSICPSVECVILSACYSEVQAQAIVRHIPYVIGMSRAILDDAAIEFAVGFYAALGANCSYKDAFMSGRTAIRGAGMEAEYQLPVLLEKESGNTVPTLWIHGWVKQTFDGVPTDELDWTSYFSKDPYRVPDRTTWQEKLLPELKSVRNRWSSLYPSRQIELRGRLSLTSMLAIGAVFPRVADYHFQVEQVTQEQTAFWRSDALASGAKFQVRRQELGAGSDLLVVLSITGRALPDMRRFVEQTPATFRAVVYAEPESGVGAGAIASNGDAVALANDAKAIISRERKQYGTQRVHLLVYSPAAFCLFLGQKLNAVGEILTYEYDNNSAVYQPSVVLMG